MWRTIALWGFRVMLGAVMFCASVGPKDVDSNISAWLDRFGLQGMARVLADQQVDTRAILISALLLGLSIFLPWWTQHQLATATPRNIHHTDMPEHAGIGDQVEADLVPRYERAVAAAAAAGITSPDGTNRFFPPTIRRAKGDRDTDASAALGFAMHGDWDHPVKSFIPMFALRGMGALEKPIETFRQAAAQGDLRVWGRRESDDLYVLIDQSFWERNTLDMEALIGFMADARTVQIAGDEDDEQFHGIMVNRSEVERVWPHEG